MKVCACLRIILESQTRGSTGNRARMNNRKSPGVTADKSHLSFDTTSCSHDCNKKKNMYLVRIFFFHFISFYILRFINNCTVSLALYNLRMPKIWERKKGGGKGTMGRRRLYTWLVGNFQEAKIRFICKGPGVFPFSLAAAPLSLPVCERTLRRERYLPFGSCKKCRYLQSFFFFKARRF